MSILVGTVDPSGWPACRGVALVVHPDREGVTVYVPVATAAETVANIASNGRLAVVSSNPVSHSSVQLKGRACAVRVAGEDERVERIEGFRSAEGCSRPDDAVTLEGHRSELRALQWVSERINRVSDLGALLDAVLEALDTYFGFRHAMLLLADEATGRLVTLGSRRLRTGRHRRRGGGRRGAHRHGGSRDTEAALPDNPLFAEADLNARRIVAFGMRSPMRFALRPGTREVW
jgi:hypothetical protein